MKFVTRLIESLLGESPWPVGQAKKYTATYKHETITVTARTDFEAQKKAADYWKAQRPWEIQVTLAENIEDVFARDWRSIHEDTYIALYRGKQYPIEAGTLLQAQQKAASQLGASREDINVVLAKPGWKQPRYKP